MVQSVGDLSRNCTSMELNVINVFLIGFNLKSERDDLTEFIQIRKSEANVGVFTSETSQLP